MQVGVPRNFHIHELLDFLAKFTRHIPPKASHLKNPKVANLGGR